MKNWDVFIIVSTFVIAIALFASDKIGAENMFENLKAAETIVVMIKTIVVALAGIISVASLIVLLLVDIVLSLLLPAEFPILQFFYHTIYLEYFREWYWDAHSGSHLFMASLILFGLGLINSYMGPVYKEKTLVYHKSKEKNYISH